jgi:Skp family chaperone for outer membrane proteins
MKTNKTGWIAAAVLAGGMLVAGFQGGKDKTGIVDVEKVFNDSTFAKSQSENLRNMGEARQSVLVFVNQYRTMKTEDATKFRDLTIKATPLSEAEKAELERIKREAQAAETKYRELSTKAGPTQDELKTITDLNTRKDANGDLLQQWQQDFTAEVQAKQQTLRGEALTKVKQAIGKVAREQGYSMIFDSQMVPYSANDLTDETLKAMNAMK